MPRNSDLAANERFALTQHSARERVDSGSSFKVRFARRERLRFPREASVGIFEAQLPELLRSGRRDETLDRVKQGGRNRHAVDLSRCARRLRCSGRLALDRLILIEGWRGASARSRSITERRVPRCYRASVSPLLE